MFCFLVKGHLKTRCTILVHLALVPAVLKMCIKNMGRRGERESVFSVVTVLSLWLFTFCTRCQLSEAMSRTVNKLRVNTWFFLLFFFSWMMVNLPKWCILSSRQSNFCSKQCYCFQVQYFQALMCENNWIAKQVAFVHSWPTLQYVTFMVIVLFV